LAGQALGITPQEAFKRLETVMDGMRQQVVAAVGQEVIDWAMRTDPKAVQNASSRQANEGTLKGWGDLNTRYMAQLDRTNPQAIVNSPDGKKLGARIEKSGEVSIEIPGAGRMSWQAALRGNFIAPRMGQVPARRAPAAAPAKPAGQPVGLNTAPRFPTQLEVDRLRAAYADKNTTVQHKLAIEKSWDGIFGKGSAARHGYTH
jgi:hypothetical protein